MSAGIAAFSWKGSCWKYCYCYFGNVSFSSLEIFGVILQRVHRNSKTDILTTLAIISLIVFFFLVLHFLFLKTKLITHLRFFNFVPYISSYIFTSLYFLSIVDGSSLFSLLLLNSSIEFLILVKVLFSYRILF